jgi:DNA-binding CsgD family transcriptional regulator
VLYTLLRQVTELDEARARAAVAIAERERILDSGPDGYYIHVDLYTEVIEADLTPSDRVRFNERYAEALRQSGAAYQGQRARHLLGAEQPREAWRCAADVAQRAQDLHRYGEAHAYWTMAASIVEKIDDPDVPADERQRMRQRAAEAAHRGGDHDSALQILDELAADLHRPLPNWWHVMRARYLARAGRLQEALAEYESAERDADNCPPEDRANIAAHFAELLVQLGRYGRAREVASKALALARDRRACVSPLVLAGSVLGFSQACLEDPASGRATIEAALAAAEKHGMPADVLCAHLWLAELLIGPLNELDSGIEVALAGAARAERSGLGRTHGARLRAVAASGLFRAGRWAEAKAVIDTGLEYDPSGAAAVELLLARTKVGLGCGDLDAGERDLAAIEALTAGCGSVRHVLPLLTLRAGLALWRGDYQQAGDVVNTALSRYDGQTEDLEMRVVLVWHGLRAAADASPRRRTNRGQPGDPRAAVDERVAALREAASHLNEDSANAAVPVRDAVDGYLALCEAELSRADGKQDVEAWERAVEAWLRRRHPYPAAYALLRLAEARYLTGSFVNAAAARTLREAHRLAMDLGARPLAREIEGLAKQVRVELQPSRETPDAVPCPTPSATGPLARLTPREAEVLALVADGKTNQRIGSILKIRPSTVGVHINRILNKLDVDNRLLASNIFRDSQITSRRDGGDTLRS